MQTYSSGAQIKNIVWLYTCPLWVFCIRIQPIQITAGLSFGCMCGAIFTWCCLNKIFCYCQFLRFATFPWMYLLSGIFKDAEMAFIIYVCINLFISVNTIMSTSILYFLGQISMRNPEVSSLQFYNAHINIFSLTVEFKPIWQRNTNSPCNCSDTELHGYEKSKHTSQDEDVFLLNVFYSVFPSYRPSRKSSRGWATAS